MWSTLFLAILFIVTVVALFVWWKINAINAARAETTRAEQDKKTAEQRAEAAKILANQPVPNLAISIAACVNKMAETGQNLNCFPIGGNVLPTLDIPMPGR